MNESLLILELVKTKDSKFYVMGQHEKEDFRTPKFNDPELALHAGMQFLTSIMMDMVRNTTCKRVSIPLKGEEPWETRHYASFFDSEALSHITEPLKEKE